MNDIYYRKLTCNVVPVNDGKYVFLKVLTPNPAYKIPEFCNNNRSIVFLA